MASNKFTAFLLKTFIGLYYLVHLLVGKVGGILVLSVLLYIFSSSLGLGQPYSFSELMLWLDQLPENSKTTVFTSVITIFGFLVAFNIGAAHQKQQFLSQMKIEATSDIEEFFNEASRNTTSAAIYAKYLIKIINQIHNDSDANAIEFHMRNVIKETEKYFATRAKLQAQEIEVHRFQGKYAIIFASSWGVIRKMEAAVDAFTNITKEIWFTTPIVNLDDPNIQQTFLKHVNVEKCNNYINAYDKYYLIMNRATGSLRGGMIAPITGVNFSFIISILKTIK